MFGIMEALLSFVRRQVGLRTDPASATGSLHAKVTDVKNYLVNTINAQLTNILSKTSGRTFCSSTVSVVSTSSSTQTLFSITGAGTVEDFRWKISNAELYGITVTIDGVVKYNNTFNGASDSEYKLKVSSAGIVEVLVSNEPANLPMDFKSSVLITFNALTSDYTITAGIAYNKI